MKKLLIASLIALSATATYAAPATQPSQNIRAKAEQLYQAKDFTASFKEFERLSKSGDAQSTFNLGQMTRFGQGTQQDNKKALKLIEKAAKQKYPLAEMALFEIYQTGQLGVKQDSVKARQHLEKASQLGWSDATVELANQYFAEAKPESDQKAIALLQPLAQQNNLSAQHLLAVYHVVNGVKTANENSIVTGIKSLETLTKQGYIPSMMAVANMSATGEVLPQNLELAKNLYTVLAQNNVPTARERLAQVEQVLAQQPKAVAQPQAKPAPAKTTKKAK